MDYCVISIREDRLYNVDRIGNVLGGPRHFPDVCNFADSRIRKEFSKNFPQFSKDVYASEPFHNFNSDRKNGEVGCWLSHISAWDYMVKNNVDSMIVTEDDLLINNQQFDIIRSEVTSKSLDVIMFGGWTACYFISQNGAKILLDNAEEGFKHHPVDFYMFSCIDDNIVNGQIGPFIVNQDPKFGTHLDFEVENDS